MALAAPTAREIIAGKTSDELLDYWRRRGDYPPEVRQVIHGLLDERGIPVSDSATTVAADQWFLHIPVARLILLSILTFSIFEAYWIYRNWRFIQEREGLDISPFWRGVFSIFFCHELLRTIHDDERGHRVATPRFSPSLATGWVLLVLVSNAVSRVPGVAGVIGAALVPSYLCLVPVQRYINLVTQQESPGRPFQKWSVGPIACAIFGALIWLLLLLPAGE